jgi:hypothetical protein
MVSLPGAVWMRCCGDTLPASMAAATENGFIVEPGSKVSVNTRLRTAAFCHWSRRFGSKLGQFASARISPVPASRTITAPAFALFASTAPFRALKAMN